MAKLQLPFELQKPDASTFVTQATEVGHNGKSVSDELNTLGSKVSKVEDTNIYLHGGEILIDSASVTYDTVPQISTIASFETNISKGSKVRITAGNVLNVFEVWRCYINGIQVSAVSDSETVEVVANDTITRIVLNSVTGAGKAAGTINVELSLTIDGYDKELTEANAKLQNLDSSVNELHEEVFGAQEAVTTDIEVNPHLYYKTKSVFDEGATVFMPAAPASTSSNYGCAKVETKAGDFYKIVGKGLSVTLGLYVLTDIEGNVLSSVAIGSNEIPQELNVEKDGYLYINIPLDGGSATQTRIAKVEGIRTSVNKIAEDVKNIDKNAAKIDDLYLIKEYSARPGYYNAKVDNIGKNLTIKVPEPCLYLTVDTPLGVGDSVIANSMITQSSSISCFVFGDDMLFIRRLGTAEANTFIMTQEDYDGGARGVSIIYNIDTQTIPFSCYRKYISLKDHEKRVSALETKTDDLESRIPTSIFTGKTVILCGDSQLGQAQSVDTLLSEITKCTVYNWGFGGCKMTPSELDYSGSIDAFCMCNVADTLVSRDFTKMDDSKSSQPSYFADTIAEMKNVELGDGDNIILTIAYGGNDSKGVPIGENDSEDKLTFKGAINYAVKTLHTAFPKLQIILIGIPYREYNTSGVITNSDTTPTKGSVESGTAVYRWQYNNAILEQAKSLHLPSFDMYYRCGRTPYNIWSLCPDGVHPTTEAGAKLEAELYYKILTSF